MAVRIWRRSRPHIEALEERAVPGTLTITPPGVVDPDIDSVVLVPDAAKPGLEMAQARTNGVISWSPDA